MAETVFGTAHVYGINGTVTNATVTAFSERNSHRVQESTVDESGVEIERRYDDERWEGTISLRIRSGYTVPGSADTIAYDGDTYEITEVSRNETSQGFREVELQILRSEGVAYS